MRRSLGSIAVLVGLVGASHAAERPSLRLGSTPTPPTIDGVISPGEWARAFQGTGFLRYGRVRTMDAVAVTYWFTYDKENLYFAIRQATPPSGRIRGRKRVTEQMPDERTEILIDPNPASADQTRFHFMGNAYGSVCDLGHNDRIGGFVPFAGDWRLANKVANGWWVQEMSTPADALGKARIKPGATWGIFWGSMRDGPHYFGWPLAAFLNRLRYLQVTFDDDAPLVHVTGLGAWEQGTIAPALTLTNTTGRAITMQVAFVLSDDKAELKREVQPVALGPNATQKVSWSCTRPRDREVSLMVRVTSPDGKTVYFHGPYRFGEPRKPVWPKPKGGTARQVTFAAYFYPGVSRIKPVVDFGTHPQADKVTRLHVAVTGPDGKPVADSKLTAFESGMGWFVIQLPKPLAQGTYKVAAQLYAGTRKVGPALADEFDKKRFPFEGNQLGVLRPSDPVPTPWTPMRADRAKGELGCWGRTHVLGPDGLPQQIVTRGQAVLAGPVRLRVKGTGGAWAPMKGTGLKFTKTHAQAVDAQAGATGGPLKAGIALHAEFDGMLRYTITFEPVGDGRVEGLDLVIPMKAERAWLLHATSDGCRTNFSHYTPKGTGRVWDSTQVMNWALSGTFIPQVWLGDDRRGLAWWADSDRGWVRPRSKREPAIEIRRRAGAVELVLHLIAQPARVTSRRTIVFALTATPMKPKPSWARSLTSADKKSTGLDGPYIRWFGSCHWAMLAKKGFADVPYTFTYLRPVSADAAACLKARMAKIHADGRIGLAYTDARARSITPESKYYAWEWNPYADDPTKAAVAARQAHQAVAINTARSRLDHDLWCLSENMKLGMDAWYFDEVQGTGQVNPAADIGYRDDQGSWQTVSRLFGLRDFLKRLYVMMQRRKHKEPLIVIHNTSTTYAGPFAFASALFDFEVSNTDHRRRHLTMYGLDYVMAETMGHQFGLVSTCLGGTNFERWVDWDHGLGDARVTRHWVGVHWLFNMRPYLYRRYDTMHVDRIMSAFGYQDPTCVWVPFWRAGRLQTVSPSRCKVSLYRRGTRAMLVILNDGPDDAVVRWKPSDRFGMVGLPQDPERDDEHLVKHIYRKPDGTWHFFVPGYDLRLIRVRCTKAWPAEMLEPRVP